MSLKRKLTAMMMGISLAAIVLTVMAITAYLIYDMRKSKVQQLDLTAAITGDRNGAALSFLDNQRVRDNLEIFRLTPSMLSACIYDAQGALFASYTADGHTEMGCSPTIQGLALTLPDMLTSYQDIRKDKDTVGHIYLAADTREINAYVHKIILISATATLIVLGITLLLAMYFQRTVSGPILELAVIAHAITANRDYTLEAKADSQDETGILAQAFNDMLREVRLRDQELMQANETLEEKVSTRTQQLEIARQKAEAASEAKSEFLRNMSHEFRTPLHAIISFSSYGTKEFESASRLELKRYFDLIQRGSERLGRLVNEVLDLARLEHGEMTLALRPGEMGDLAARSVELLRPLIEEKGITLKLDLGKAFMPLRCDHDKIVQVITNLLSNATKFTPRGKAITLHTETVLADDGAPLALLSLIDEGIGIPSEEQELIFESFRQSSRTNTGAGGTGLGLAICRGIVSAHGGRIWAQNNESGTGARVSFVLPFATDISSSLSPERKNDTAHAA